jgi:hypothetical protein
LSNVLKLIYHVSGAGSVPVVRLASKTSKYCIIILHCSLTQTEEGSSGIACSFRHPGLLINLAAPNRNDELKKITILSRIFLNFLQFSERNNYIFHFNYLFCHPFALFLLLLLCQHRSWTVGEPAPETKRCINYINFSK